MAYTGGLESGELGLTPEQIRVMEYYAYDDENDPFEEKI